MSATATETDGPLLADENFTPGNSVTVSITGSGAALVLLDAQIATDNASELSCQMGILVETAGFSKPPGDSRLLTMPQGVMSTFGQESGSASVLVTGLSAGTYVFTPMYRATSLGTCTISYGKATIIPQ